MSIVRMTSLDLKGKRVLIREDLNVPLKDGKVAGTQVGLVGKPQLAAFIDKGL